MKPSIIDKILVTGLAVGLIILGYMYDSKVKELDSYRQSIKSTIEPVSECVQLFNAPPNQQWRVSDYGLLGFTCDRRVGEAVHKLLIK